MATISPPVVCRKPLHETAAWPSRFAGRLAARRRPRRARPRVAATGGDAAADAGGRAVPGHCCRVAARPAGRGGPRLPHLVVCPTLGPFGRKYLLRRRQEVALAATSD